jgi:hypothetical protein
MPGRKAADHEQGKAADHEQTLSALAEQLGAPPPAALEALTPAQLADLTQAVHDARRRQAAELAAAGERAFQALPRLLRAPVRRILG